MSSAAPMDSATVRPFLLLAGAALLVGAANALVFVGFEWVIKHGTDWLWNDVAGTDDARWRVVPLALGLSIAFSAVLRWLGERRFVEPHLDPLKGAEASQPPTTWDLATILLVGAASLLAGASLGPEAPLAALAAGLGAWAAARGDFGAAGRSLVLASVGALLVAFFGSLIPIAIPLLMLYQRAKRLDAAPLTAIVVAGVAAWATLWLVQDGHSGYGQIPSDAVRARDYFAAFGLGIAAVGVGASLRWFVRRLARVTRRIDAAFPWWLAAAIVGAALGGLYLAGGPAVQFSGSEGTSLLLSGDLHYEPLALLGIVLIKLLATGWSLSAGYRGGLVFPSVLAGVAVSLFAAEEWPDVAGPGVLLGCVAGLLVEMTAPLLGAVMLLALLPAALLPLGLAGAAGAVLARTTATRLGGRASPPPPVEG